MQPKARILTVYGAFVRDFGGWISISSLVELMGDLGVDPQAVRSATSRMKRRRLLLSEKIDGLAGYRLTPAATQILRDGDTRIFRGHTDTSDPSWIVVLFSVPEAERRKRYVIRSRLTSLGFAQGHAGSWFAPASVTPETRRMLDRENLSHYCSIWRGDYIGNGDIKTIVAKAWDLQAVQEQYNAFLERFGDVEVWLSKGGEDQREAFVNYLNLLATWQPLLYMDPGLPDSVTLDDWPAAEARSLFMRLNTQLRPLAMQHFVAVAVRS